MKGPFTISSSLIAKHNFILSPTYYEELVEKGELVVVDGEIQELPEEDMKPDKNDEA